MNANAIFKALSNEHRLQILLWLKTPEQHFAAERLSTAEETGVVDGVRECHRGKNGADAICCLHLSDCVERRGADSHRACRKMDVLLLPA